MSKQDYYSRRDILRSMAGVSAFGPTLRSIAVAPRDAHKTFFRFAIASDLHFGQKETPFAKNMDHLISMLNEENNEKGLDAVFLNGDIVHDSTTAYEGLRSNYLTELNSAYYAIKGNHDYVDENKGSPGESWETIWGYPSNHVVEIRDLTFILADTSASRQSGRYLPADIGWLQKQLEFLKSQEVIFVFMHIAQRKQGVQGWPRYGVGHHEAEDTKAGEAVMTLLESYKNVRAVFHGHDHNAVGRHISGGTPYFFDSHVGGSFGNKKGYRIVEVYADNSMATYQYNIEDSVIMNRHSF